MSRRQWVILLIVGLGLIAGSHLLDRWAYLALAHPAAGDRDWGRFLRIMGFAPTWGVLALALWLDDRRSSAAWQVVIAVVVAGLLAEVFKLLIRRDRPTAALEYTFRAFSDQPLNSRNFGIPSSHVMVAFAGASALSRRFPRIAPLLYLLAAGCGLSRLMAQAHYLSDVVAGAVGGTLVGVADWARTRRQ
jgi:membrane-associated phospholipid phosphatase